MRLQYEDGAERLTLAFPNLSRQLQKCAAYILEHPSDVATLSMRQVATRAGVLPSNMNRLARTLGFTGYNEFREIYRNSVNEISVSYPQKAGQLQAAASDSEFEKTIDTFHRSSISNLDGLFKNLDRNAVVSALGILEEARNVTVVGMHASYAFADYLQYIAAMCFRNWNLVTRLNGELSDRVAGLNPDDALVAISLRPCAADTIKVAKRAYETGVRVVGITDSRTSPLAAYSTIVLLAPNRSPGFFDSYVATTALLEMLMGMIVARGDRSIVHHIEKIENCRHELGEYWDQA